MNQQLMDGLKREAICQVSRAMREGNTVRAMSWMCYLNWIAEAEAVIDRFGPQLKLWICQERQESVNARTSGITEVVSTTRPQLGPKTH